MKARRAVNVMGRDWLFLTSNKTHGPAPQISPPGGGGVRGSCPGRDAWTGQHAYVPSDMHVVLTRQWQTVEGEFNDDVSWPVTQTTPFWSVLLLYHFFNTVDFFIFFCFCFFYLSSISSQFYCLEKLQWLDLSMSLEFDNLKFWLLLSFCIVLNTLGALTRKVIGK